MTERVAVLGLGLIGGSLGAALRDAGYRVCGYDISSRHADAALRAGLVDEILPSAGAAAREVDAVLLAVPVLRSLKLLLQLDQVCPPETLILDTGSAKQVVVDAMSTLPGSSRMVGGHPLAGSERSGPAAADPNLFRERTFFLCATPETADESRRHAETVVHALGSNPHWVAAAEHDAMLAATSHLPQILSSILAASVQSPGQYAGPSFRDMTRLAGSDATIWRDILLANAHEVVRAGRSYGQALASLIDAIETEDVASIEDTILRGQQARELLEVGT